MGMTKLEFIEKLTAELKRSSVADAADIIEEYEQHFAFKLSDGYTEEEIAAKLGDPKEIAAQYAPAPAEKTGGKKVVPVIGLGVTDFFFGVLYSLLCAWEIIMGVFTVAVSILSVNFIGNLSLLKYSMALDMPVHCAIVLGIAFAALTVLSAIGTIYFFGFIKQLARSFGRFHKNALAAASGKATLPPLPVYPQFTGKTKRMLRKTATLSTAVFAVCFLAGFVTCVITAGSFEFWHTWGWFGYVS